MTCKNLHIDIWYSRLKKLWKWKQFKSFFQNTNTMDSTTVEDIQKAEYQRISS